MPRSFKNDPAYQTNLPEFENFDRFVFVAYGQPEADAYQVALAQAQVFVEDGRLLLKTLMESTANSVAELALPPQMNHEYTATCLQWLCFYHAIQMGHPMHKGMYVIDLGSIQKNDVLFNVLTGAGYVFNTTTSLPITFHNIWHTASMGLHLTTSLATYFLSTVLLEFARERNHQLSLLVGFTTPYARVSSHFNYHMALGSYQYGIDSKNYRYPYVVKPNLDLLRTSLIIRLDDGRIALKPENRGIDLSKNLFDSIEHLQNWGAGTQVHEGIIDLREKRIDFDLISLAVKFIELVPEYAELTKKLIDAQSKPQYEGLDKQAKLIYETIGFYPDIIRAMDKYSKENEAITPIRDNLIARLKERYGEDTYLKQFGRETTLDFAIADVNTPYFGRALHSVMQVPAQPDTKDARTEEFNKIIDVLQRDLIATQQLHVETDERKMLKTQLVTKIQTQLDALVLLKGYCQNKTDGDDELMKKCDNLIASLDDPSLKSYAQKYYSGNDVSTNVAPAPM